MSGLLSLPIRRRLRVAAVLSACAAGSLALMPASASASHAGEIGGSFCDNVYISGGGTCIHSARHRLSQTYGESNGVWVKDFETAVSGPGRASFTGPAGTHRFPFGGFPG